MPAYSARMTPCTLANASLISPRTCSFPALSMMFSRKRQTPRPIGRGVAARLPRRGCPPPPRDLDARFFDGSVVCAGALSRAPRSIRSDADELHRVDLDARTVRGRDRDRLEVGALGGRRLELHQRLDQRAQVPGELLGAERRLADRGLHDARLLDAEL